MDQYLVESGKGHANRTLDLVEAIVLVVGMLA